MGPRADFACRKCGKNDGLDGTKMIEDLPVGCLRCPICSSKRGFMRLFNAVNVNGGAGRVLNKVLDMTLEPLFEKHADTTQSAKAFEAASTEAIERSTHEATPAQRSTAQPFRSHIQHNAAAALGNIPAASRQDSREVIYPALTNKIVRPQWERTRSRN